MEIQHGDGLSPFGPRRPAGEPRRRRSRLLLGVRYGVPLVIFLAGCGILLMDSDRETALEGAFTFFGVAIAVLLLNTFFRIGQQGEGERDREEEARAYFDRHGRWPE
ncbi:MAG: hypothetical protein NVS2B6_05290 [Thermoleophilaceae bacterium]